MKKIFVINDHSVAKGGADFVAISQNADLIEAGFDAELFSVVDKNLIKSKDDLQAYPLKAKYFFKNFFWLKAYKKAKKKFSLYKEAVYIVHSWTKQLSSSIFFALKEKNVYIVTHDYFIVCPNGGLYDYKKMQKCKISGGGLRCLATNCDKSSYLVKIYRWLRFWVLQMGLKICKPRIIALNELQLSLFSHFPHVLLLKNKIDQRHNFSEKNFSQRKYLTYIGRGDPEKGVSILSDSKLVTSIPILIIGPEKGALGPTLGRAIYKGWLNESEMTEYVDQTLIGIFPSLWSEVDPLTPWKFFARAVPVACCRDNVFGQFLAKEIPDLVYSDVEELNKIFLKIEDKIYYEEICTKVKNLYISEEKLRAEIWTRGFDEIIN